MWCRRLLCGEDLWVQVSFLDLFFLGGETPFLV